MNRCGPGRARPLLVSLLLGAIALLGACDRTPSPEASLRAFIAAAAAGDHQRAWLGLCAETRVAADALARVSREALLAAGEVPPADGKALLFGQGLEMIREVKSIEERSRDETRAVLRVSDSKGAILDLEMRFEGGRWKLHLPLNG